MVQLQAGKQATPASCFCTCCCRLCSCCCSCCVLSFPSSICCCSCSCRVRVITPPPRLPAAVTGLVAAMEKCGGADVIDVVGSDPAGAAADWAAACSGLIARLELTLVSVGQVTVTPISAAMTSNAIRRPVRLFTPARRLSQSERRSSRSCRQQGAEAQIHNSFQQAQPSSAQPHHQLTSLTDISKQPTDWGAFSAAETVTPLNPHHQPSMVIRRTASRNSPRCD